MSKPRDDRQKDLLLPALDQIIDMGHPLVRLAALIDWKFLDDRFGSVWQTGPGQPGPPCQPMRRECTLRFRANSPASGTNYPPGQEAHRVMSITASDHRNTFGGDGGR